MVLQVIADDIKKDIPIVRGSKGTVACNVLRPGQTWNFMLGYVQKDQGKPTFAFVSQGVPDFELLEVILCSLSSPSATPAFQASDPVRVGLKCMGAGSSGIQHHQA